jgi:hypothetical protein
MGAAIHQLDVTSASLLMCWLNGVLDFGSPVRQLPGLFKQQIRAGIMAHILRLCGLFAQRLDLI